MTQSTTGIGCSGFRRMSRRSAIQTGVCGALGLSVGDMLRLEAADDSAFTQSTETKKEPKALSIIQLHLPGGFQQQESLDPKPEAPVEIRGAVAELPSGGVPSNLLLKINENQRKSKEIHENQRK